MGGVYIGYRIKQESRIGTPLRTRAIWVPRDPRLADKCSSSGILSQLYSLLHMGFLYTVESWLLTVPGFSATG